MDSIKVNGKRIRKFRNKKGWSVGELAKSIGMKNAQYLYRIERGEQRPSFTLLSRIAAALEVPSTLLIEDEIPVSDETAKILDAIHAVSSSEKARLTVGVMSFDVPDEILDHIIKFILVYNEPR